jgi:hypothetical protein
MDNRGIDALLVRELPGYESVFAPTPQGAIELRALAAFGWKRGTFRGWPHLEWRGPRLYLFSQDPKLPFSFQRSTGETLTPQAMDTDAGSIPRVVWSLPGLSPWDYLPAYVIHDWDFRAHHCGLSDRSFEEANLTLAEGIFTLMMTGIAKSDWIRIEIIYRAVSSPFGRNVWDNGPCPRSQPG